MLRRILIIAVFAFGARATAPEAGCSFRQDPGEFLQSQSRARLLIHERAGAKLGLRRAGVTVEPSAIRRRSFIDEQIFGTLERLRVPSAAVSTDEEFVRRIHLDLTGRIPPPSSIRDFLSSRSANKREELIEQLLYTPEFADRWAVWFADLIQSTERLSTNA
ncbi:MAG TPA: DUF1549 domain-containing protein, partial [Bryobacteraceae bacterium]|nr:DUF1549 domain-containing protein [Bryobacteraceae bacterium]